MMDSDLDINVRLRLLIHAANQINPAANMEPENYAPTTSENLVIYIGLRVELCKLENKF